MEQAKLRAEREKVEVEEAEGRRAKGRAEEEERRRSEVEGLRRRVCDLEKALLKVKVRLLSLRKCSV